MNEEVNSAANEAAYAVWSEHNKDEIDYYDGFVEGVEWLLKRTKDMDSNTLHAYLKNMRETQVV